jgi:hypothetical protein
MESHIVFKLTKSDWHWVKTLYLDLYISKSFSKLLNSSLSVSNSSNLAL